MSRADAIAAILDMKDRGITDIQVTLPGGQRVYVADKNHEPCITLDALVGPNESVEVGA